MLTLRRNLLLPLLLPFCSLILLLGFSSRHAAGNNGGTIIISEVGWGGTAASSSDEWIELYNASKQSVSIEGWRLLDNSGDVDLTLSGEVAPSAFFLLERTADDTLSNVEADEIYTGSLLNEGEVLTLLDDQDNVVDRANEAGGAWPAGSGSPMYLSMERVEPVSTNFADEWRSYDGPPSTALDADGNPVFGTPDQPNLVWSSEPEPPATPGSGLVIDALLYDGYETSDDDEAVRLYNASSAAVNLSGWQLGDSYSSGEVITESIEIAPAEAVWVAKDGAAFRRQFGFDPQVLLAPWPGFANAGDEVLLRNPEGSLVDLLVYKDGDTTLSGWSGGALWPYRSAGLFAEEGQILYRMREQSSGEPVADSDVATDWAQSTEDVINGRKVQYPGWSLQPFFFPELGSSPATITVAVAPDNAYETILQQIASAQESIHLVSHTFENPAIAQALADAARRGVEVVVLLEGAPVGGLTDQERYICELLARAGGTCWFMVRDDLGGEIHDRYRYLHAKYAILDGHRAIISSENLSANSMPFDDKSDGTWGRRGVLLVTDAAPVVARLEAIFDDDFAPETHQDLLQWTPEHPIYGSPPTGFVPVTESGGITYTVRYESPVSFQGTFDFSVIQSPENSLRSDDGLLGLLARAGSGDTVLVQQLSERPFWGASTSNPQEDPNPRLEAYIDAARRGARVSLLLDSFFDDPTDATSNAATCEYVNQLAVEEHLRLQCALTNPAGLGIHNKMVLAEIAGKGWVHVGSLNGTELSSKGNREVALQVQSDGAYAYLAAMFDDDWPNQLWLPLLMHEVRGPVGYPLVSELLYDPPGPDEAEFIEIANPTYGVIDLSHWLIGDAVHPDDFEDLRRFPAGTVLPPEGALIVAASATGFYAEFGFRPDFEVVSSDLLVPDLEDVVEWGDPAALLQLGNEGDELLLRRPDGQVVDAVTYGAGLYSNLTPCALLPAAGQSLERFPYWLDSDECAADFRAWPFPNPGTLP